MGELKIPQGYKLTEVGVIPNDWDIYSLANFCRYQNGKAQEQYFNLHDGYKVVSIGNYSESGRYIETGNYIDRRFKNEVGRFLLNCGDLAMILNDKTAVGTILGRVILIDEDEAYVMNQRTMRLTPKDFVISKYLHCLINSESVHKRIVGMAKPGTQIYINTDDVLNFNLPFPKSKKEQTAIANALSDVDALISSLEKLINKKQAIKTASMQQLLTGKTRLPQFAKYPHGKIKGTKQSELGEVPEDWEVVEFGDFLSGLEGGVSVNSVEDMNAFSHGMSILKTSCVANGYFNPSEGKGIVPKDIKRAKLNPKKGCIIISRMNTPDLVGEIGYVDNDYLNLFLPDRLWQTKYNSSVEVNGRWLAFMLSYPDVSKKIKEAATGTSNSMKNISKGNLLAIKFAAPNCEEQTAIATILSDMDTEIQTLEQRLNKTRHIKQGMMQELLTGKTRLV
jgi:type I restriction enzyme S subunit